MARNQKRHQKALARQAAKRKAKRKTLARGVSALNGPSMSGAEKWSLLECLISASWRDTTSLCQILVARQAPGGAVGTGVFLVDLGCMGLKSGFIKVFSSILEYRSTLRSGMMRQQDMMMCDIALAAKVLKEGIKFAEGLGFRPEKDGRKALRLLGDADPRDCTETVPLGGKDGKPFFIAGPHDDVPRIKATLERTVGMGGFHFIAIDGPPPDLFD